MITDELTKQIEDIDTLIRSKIIDPTNKAVAVLDGIVDPEKYFAAKYKILWVLKEPNDENPDAEGITGNWDLREFVDDGVTGYGNWKRTWLPILYTASAIFDGCMYEDLDFYDKMPEMMEVLKDMAYINVKKLPGGAVSYYAEISSAYNLYRDILLKQIEVYNPEIIIFAGTTSFFVEDLGIDATQIEEKGYYATKERLYIKSMHPNQRSSNQEDYCNNIINSVREWQNLKALNE